MQKVDYYEILGVQKNASPSELKSAYRKKAMELHPDRNPGNKDAEHQFKAVNEAYAILKDEQTRAQYDTHGHAAFENGGRGNGGFDAHGFADIFDEMFGEFMGGGRRGASRARHGADLRYDMEITLEEAFHGKEVQIRIPTADSCDTCSGSGAAPGSSPQACGTCSGRGRVRMQQGFFTMERACPTCQGQGQVVKDPCKDCRGQGRVMKEKNLQVTIPAGVEDGTRIRLSGEGEAGMRGGPKGDLYIFLSIKPHKLFQRHGANLLCEVPIPMTTAALGGSVEVPTIDGKRSKVTIPPGTQNAHRFRLKHKGMSVVRSQRRGDLYLDIAVEIPKNLTKKQKELLEDFKKDGNEANQHPSSTGFFTKVKDFFESLAE